MRKTKLSFLLFFLFTVVSIFQGCKGHEEKMIDKIAGLKEKGYPMIDYHAHLKGGLSMEQLLEHSRKTGIRYGVAINAGLGFPVDNDSALIAAYNKYKDYSVWLAMQAEGREWVNMFSPGAVNLFDYVFTDAMTYTDADGLRMRLWIKEEVYVEDAQDFMDYLVAQVETILDNEEIDIYVNPTYLPEIIQHRYDELWTDQRIEKILDALVKNDIAMEINARMKIPSAKIIRKAKKAGVKFTLGTNNVGPRLGYLEYGMEMIEKCDLEPSDFWVYQE
jgi:hypothetical protein